MPAETTAQPARNRAKTHRAPAEGQRRRIFREKVLVDAASPFPAQPARKRPAWWIRLRGLIGLSILTVLLGVLLAVLVGTVLVVLAVWALTSLT
jgi:hypothetical protein